MWSKLPKEWKACFEEAWDSYCHGSLPIGAVVVDANHDIISRGRNRIYERTAPTSQTCSNRLAHAEVNALLQIHFVSSDDYKTFTLYTTTEPCVLCFGAITMAGVRKVRFAAVDPMAGGGDLNYSTNVYIQSKGIDIDRDATFLGEIQQVLMTDFLIRQNGEDKAKPFLEEYAVEYPRAIALGRKWFNEDVLLHAKQDGLHISAIVDKIAEEIETIEYRR